MKYIPTIGLEIHAELATKSKMFCSCRNDPDENRPNTNVCPICMGHPGTLPVLNREAIRHVLKVGLAVGGKLADFTEWDRKNYFYPDIPKGYQISQYKYPLVSGGAITVRPAGLSAVAEPMVVTVTRIHLEEDTGQSTHDAHATAGVEKSLVNFNRAGVPLMELVTEPVIHDAATAVAFAKELQLLLRCLGAGEANMEKGEMRVEANISVATEEDTLAGKFGTKTEVKNLNSFRAVERAIAYEIDRQTRIIEKNTAGQGTEKVFQETRGWDDNAGKTFSQRAKESSHDYRYFPDPDIPKMKLSEIEEFSGTGGAVGDALRAELPELPWMLRSRLKKDFGMTDKEAEMFVGEPVLFKYLNDTLAALPHDPKIIRLAVNYISTDYVGLLKKEYGTVDVQKYLAHSADIPAEIFARLIALIASAKVNSRGAKDTLAALFETAKKTPIVIKKSDQKNNPNIDPAVDPERVAEAAGFIQKTDENELKKMVAEIVDGHQNVVAEYRAGNVAVLQFLIGQGMKKSRGSANPEALKKLLIEKIG